MNNMKQKIISLEKFIYIRTSVWGRSSDVKKKLVVIK